MLNQIDPHEVFRDLINWLDGTMPGWQGLGTKAKSELLEQACAYFAEVSRRYHIPESDFEAPLREAASQVRLIYAIS